MIAKFEKTSLSNQTIPQGHMFSLGSKNIFADFVGKGNPRRSLYNRVFWLSSQFRLFTS